MTGEEAILQVAHLLGGVRKAMEGHGYRVRFFGRAELEAMLFAGIEVPGPDAAALEEVRAVGGGGGGGFTGNLCPVCQTPMRPAGGCELCPNCGTTSSCG